MASGMQVTRVVPNLTSERFSESREFYTQMFDLVVSVEHNDWYLQLMPPGQRSVNIGFLKPGHEFFAGRPSPIVLTVQVDDVDAAYTRAERMGSDVVSPLVDEDYGQRHFLVVDPNGVVLNVMSPLPG